MSSGQRRVRAIRQLGTHSTGQDLTHIKFRASAGSRALLHPHLSNVATRAGTTSKRFRTRLGTTETLARAKT